MKIIKKILYALAVISIVLLFNSLLFIILYNLNLIQI